LGECVALQRLLTRRPFPQARADRAAFLLHRDLSTIAQGFAHADARMAVPQLQVAFLGAQIPLVEAHLARPMRLIDNVPEDYGSPRLRYLQHLANTEDRV